MLLFFSYGVTAILTAAWVMTGPLWAENHTPAQIARIGVLAFRGAQAASRQWDPLASYLSQSITGWKFQIVPVTLVSASEKIRNKELEFLITNPGHYVSLSEKFGLSVLATRERRSGPATPGLLKFGTAIFVLRKAGLNTLGDLRGKRIAAVSPDAFGGFQLSWHEFVKQNIDPFRDLKSVRFMGFPQDAIVSAVRTGEVDAGVVRSGLLESLAAEGRIAPDDFVVLQGNNQPGYPHRVSGALYPEWPFTAVPGIEKSLREDVGAALLASQRPTALSRQLGDLWSAPLSYESVRRLTAAYHQRDTAAGRGEQFPASIRAALVALLAGALLAMLLMARRRGLTATAPARPDPPETLDQAALSIKNRFETLTRREREVLSMICTGEQSKTIASKLGISPKTVEYHRSNLLHKTQSATSAQLVQLATRFGYDLGVSPGS